jgi:hypothetical protein
MVRGRIVLPADTPEGQLVGKVVGSVAVPKKMGNDKFTLKIAPVNHRLAIQVVSREKLRELREQEALKPCGMPSNGSSFPRFFSLPRFPSWFSPFAHGAESRSTGAVVNPGAAQREEAAAVAVREGLPSDSNQFVWGTRFFTNHSQRISR